VPSSAPSLSTDLAEPTTTTTPATPTTPTTSAAPRSSAAPPTDAPATTAAGSDFAPLLNRVRAAGLLRRRPWYYTRLIVGNLLLFAGLWAAVVRVGDSWWQLALAPLVAVSTARTAFLGHDSGHQQITASRRASRLLGLAHGNLMIGLSEGWWNSKHNRHHANPNHLDKDPDVGVGALVWSAEQAAERRGFARWLTRHQAALFFPMLLLEGFALKVAGVRDLRNRPPRQRAVEATLLLAHAAWYTALLLLVMSPIRAVAFVLVHQALFGLHLGCAFAPNHKGMPTPPAHQRWDHLRRQVYTSRSVRGGVVLDWLLGGLNYQIEHHLFPSMPRPQLREAQPLVRAHCLALGLPYVRTGLVESYRQGLRHLRTVGAPLRARPPHAKPPRAVRRLR
jgi:fatty acid desaturase